MTHPPCTNKQCQEIGCCLNCAEYKGAVEFIPTVLDVSCPHRERVVLKLHGYPEVNGKSIKNCEFWKSLI